MVEVWLIEILKAVGKIFLNPLLYWAIFLGLIASNKRIQQERINFGFKVFDVFSEWKNTWILSIGAGILISLLTIGLGMVFSFETIWLLSIVIIILSLSFRFTLLSASYTIGVTYLLLLFIPFLLDYQTFFDPNLFSHTNFSSLVILLGVFLIVEAIMIRRVKRNETFPQLTLSKRGIWIGQHHLKKLNFIPFFVVVPTGAITPFAPYWPFFSLGEHTYSLLLVPFLIGFDYLVRGDLPRKASIKISNSISLLGILVVLLAVGSVFISWLSLAAVLVAILGKEYINYRHRITDKDKPAYFNQIDEGLKVLGVIPGTPADRLHILIGETIVKVNDKKIHTIDEFYEALQNSGAFFKLEVIDDAGEVRFVQSALYEQDHHELGLVFTDEPYRKNK